MHSLSKMASASYFPSIHDNTTENKIWAPFHPKRQQLARCSTVSSSDKGCKGGADHSSSTTQRVEAEAAWTTVGPLASPDYQPLDVFSVTGEDAGPASWSEAEELCELSIRLKDIELRDMMGETSGIPEYTFMRNIRYCRMKQARRKIPGEKTKRHNF